MKYKGIIYIIISAFFFALMSLFIRLSGDIPFYQKSFFRNIVALAVSGFVLFRKRQELVFDKKAIPDLLLRSLFGTLGLFCNFYAVDHMNLSDASMLNKMSPFFAIIFSFILLKEKITIPQALMVLVAFGGALFVIKPSFGNMDFVPGFIGLMGGLGAGVAYTFVRRLGMRKISSPIIIFCFSLFSTIIIIPFLIFNFVSMTELQLLYLFLTGVCATFGQFFITSAYVHAPAKEISVYDYSQIIFSAILGLIFFQMIPDPLSFVGYGIIILMAVLMFLYNNRPKKEETMI